MHINPDYLPQVYEIVSIQGRYLLIVSIIIYPFRYLIEATVVAYLA